MKKAKDISIKHMEGRSFIIGREGHIYIDSPSASKQHAELKIIGGHVYLRDLKSSNGTYLIKNNKYVPFEEGFVSLLQPVIIGNRRHVIKNLLSIARTFAASNDAETELGGWHPSKIGQQAS